MFQPGLHSGAEPIERRMKHRMRNDLVHTPGFVLSLEDAKMALEGYEAFLKELEVI